MADFLGILARDAEETILEGYYEVATNIETPVLSLKDRILKCTRAPVIAEIKFASPSSGTIRSNVNVGDIAAAMKNGGAVGISILTEPKHFKGSLHSFIEVRRQVQLPLLMKDIIIHPIQLEAASKIGANTVLLIMSLFKQGYTKCGVKDMIGFAHSKKLEVLLETHTKDEFLSALKTEADLIGVNNRDLNTLRVDLKVTQRILSEIRVEGRVVVSESGIQTPADIRFLHRCGAHAFLVGTALMSTDRVEGKVKELVMAL